MRMESLFLAMPRDWWHFSYWDNIIARWYLVLSAWLTIQALYLVRVQISFGFLLDRLLCPIPA